MGLCNGAGWATSLDGRDAVLLGIEKIIELNWQDESAMQALIFHEIGHIWHKTYGISPRLGQRAKNHWLSSIKRDLPWSANIFYAKMTDTIIKIKTAGSIGARKTEAEIKREYLRRVDKNISTQDFFGIGAATKITAMLAIIWAASSSNICSGNTRLSI